MAPGLFAQHGVAKEVLFHGFVFRHLRTGRPFGRAAFLAMLFFAAAHLWLFTYMALPLALAATVLALAMAFPLAALFERGGDTVWGAALLHLAMHAIKVVHIPAASQMPAALSWMGAYVALPYLVFA